MKHWPLEITAAWHSFKITLCLLKYNKVINCKCIFIFESLHKKKKNPDPNLLGFNRPFFLLLYIFVYMYVYICIYISTTCTEWLWGADAMQLADRWLLPQSYNTFSNLWFWKMHPIPYEYLLSTSIGVEFVPHLFSYHIELMDFTSNRVTSYSRCIDCIRNFSMLYNWDAVT